MRTRYLALMMFLDGEGDGGTGGGDAGAGAGSGSGAGSPAGGGGAGSTPAGTADRSSAGGNGGGENQNIRQLRTEYEGLKTKFEGYSKLGELDALTHSHTTWNKVYTAASELGRSLGYTDDEIKEAVEAEPLKVLAFLQQQANRGGGQNGGRGQGNGQGNGDGKSEQQRIQELINDAVGQAMTPIQERENVQLTNAANNKFEQHTMGLITTHLKGLGFTGNVAATKEADTLMRITSELIKYDKGALHALKHEGKTAMIQKYFNEALSMADAYYADRFARESARTGARPGGGGGASGKGAAAGAGGAKRGPTLDEIIENPGLAGKKYE